ncbi:MAG: 8-oxoguanine deaminase [Acidimicrobiia bacterium]|nr:8-oxoguanine deaminase [Acidimicrobiia bacterium]
MSVTPGEAAGAGGAPSGPVDVLVRGAELLVTMDDERREIAGGWVSVRDGAVEGVGEPGTEPAARDVIDGRGCLVTPGLVNTHHHMYQNLTRAFAPALGGDIFHWLRVQYPIWARLDEEAAYVSAWIGCIELALGGCTTTTDHLYVHPRDGGDLISAEIGAAAEVGLRFHATRGSMSLSEKDGGLPPDSVVQDDDEILADSQRLVEKHHDRSDHAMTQVALAPCSPFSVTPELMRSTAELADRLDVRLHTHIAETVGEDEYCLEHFGRRPIDYFEDCGWATDRAWVAHAVHPNASEIARLGRWGTGVAHCPSSNMLIGAGLAPVRELREADVPVGLGCDGSASTDCASLWMEARNALLLGRLRHGGQAMGARDALEMGTRGGARCLGREATIGRLAPGACGDLVVWPLEGVAFAGALTDPVEAWLRCGPVAARHTVVGGRVLVRDGRPVDPRVDEMLALHRAIAAEWQQVLA